MKCHKCQAEMQATPICTACGTIPIAEASFGARDKLLLRAGRIIEQYRTKTPPGNQPHMLAGVADQWLAEVERN